MAQQYSTEASLAPQQEQPASWLSNLFDVSRWRLTSRVILAALLVLVLSSFALRIYDLDGQSMWSDEGLSLYRARLQTADILQGLIIIDGVETHDTNPPLYFLILHAMRQLAGETIFALRYSGVLAGVLAVPLIYVLGTAAFGRPVGLLAALLMTLSPFHVWQSQVLRNYSLLLTLNLASVYGLFRYILAPANGNRLVWLGLWLTAGLLSIYTHYFGFFVFAYSLSALIGVTLLRKGVSILFRQKRTWVILVGGLLLLTPAVFIAYDRFSAGKQFDFHPISLTQILGHAAGAFAIGISPSLTHPWWLYFPAVLLALFGLIIGWRKSLLPTMLLVGYQVIPLGLMILLSLFNPLYNGVRHLLIALPPFLLFIALGAGSNLKMEAQGSFSNGLRKFWPVFRILVFLLVLVIQIYWLWVQFEDPRLIRDDIRGAAEYLNENAGPQDLIILHDTIIGTTFDYYYDGAAPVIAIPQLGEQDLNHAQELMREAGRQADRVWFMAQPTPRTGFPRDALRHWTENNWPRFFSQEFPSMWLRVQLNGYLPRPAVENLPAEAKVLDLTFAGSLGLSGFAMAEQVKAGEPWWMSFYWSQLEADNKDYVFSLRLIDQDGRLWRQFDELVWQEYLEHQWPAGTLLRKDYEQTIASGIPPGQYDVQLRVLDLNRQPIPAADGQIDHTLGQISVEAGTNMDQLPPFTWQRANLGEVEFLGFNLPEDGIRPGHGIPIELFWRVRKTPAEDYQVRTRLIDPGGHVVSEALNLPTIASYPMSHWQPGELLQSKFQMLMPGNVAITPHNVEAALIDTDGNVVGSITLQEPLTADPWPFIGDLPPGLDPIGAEIGQPPIINLRGSKELEDGQISPGDPVSFTLFWQAVGEVEQGYYVFIHLIAEDGTIVSQLDGAPMQGFRPTTSWRVGEVIEDQYLLPTSTDLPPGKYWLWTGMYHPGTGERPPVSIDGQKINENRILLKEFTVPQEK